MCYISSMRVLSTLFYLFAGCGLLIQSVDASECSGFLNSKIRAKYFQSIYSSLSETYGASLGDDLVRLLTAYQEALLQELNLDGDVVNVDSLLLEGDLKRIRTALPKITQTGYFVEVYSRRHFPTYLNRTLRRARKGPITPLLQLFQEGLEMELKAAPRWSGPVYRGIAFKSLSDIENLPAVGKVYSDPAFLSTSKSIIRAKSYMSSMAGEHRVLMVFQVQDAPDISGFRVAFRDEEVLFPPGTSFKVMEVKKVPAPKRGQLSYIEIHLEQIGL